MTTLLPYKEIHEEFEELLIKNLPLKIKGGNEKYTANIYQYYTAKALSECKFINFNTPERISFMIFDIDEYENKTAKEYFKNIDGFFDYLANTIGLEPTYILETDKGFHFAYHLKNHIFTNQPKALKYLQNIKDAITTLLHCDPIASNRLYGVWRNPLLHNHYYSQQINYELNDFKYLLHTSNTKLNLPTTVKVNKEDLEEGNRNNSLFMYAMRFAKGQNYLTKNLIFDFLEKINSEEEVELNNKELNQISGSVFKYWQNDKIEFGIISTKNRNINKNIMAFKKMKNLNKTEYEAERKKRQSAAAKRTLKLRDSEKNKQQLLKAKAEYQEKQKLENKLKVDNAVELLKTMNKKISYAALSKETSLDRRTVKKYFNMDDLNTTKLKDNKNCS